MQLPENPDYTPIVHYRQLFLRIKNAVKEMIETWSQFNMQSLATIPILAKLSWQFLFMSS